MVAPVAVSSNMTNNCNGGEENESVCQVISPNPSASSEVASPVNMRLRVSRFVREPLQLMISAPSVEKISAPPKTTVNQGLGGSVCTLAIGGIWANSR